jgi:hypothetical protein
MIRLEDIKPDIGCMLLLSGTPTKPLPVPVSRDLLNLLREYNDANGRLQQEIKMLQEAHTVECVGLATLLRDLLLERQHKNAQKRRVVRIQAQEAVDRYLDEMG